MTQKHDIMEFEEFAGAFRAAFDGGAKHGKEVAQVLCQRDGKEFTTSQP